MIYLQETYQIIEKITISVYIANTGLDKLPNAWTFETAKLKVVSM